MNPQPDLEAVYAHSENVVARVIEGEIIIVPLTAGIGDMEDELYTLNETGRVIWERLDGQTPLAGVIASIAAEYNATPGAIERDVPGLVAELLRRRMIEDVRRA